VQTDVFEADSSVYTHSEHHQHQSES